MGSPIFVSTSRSNSLEAGSHRYFDRVEITSLEQLSQVMVSNVWSPIVWKDNTRLSANFDSAQIIALDFDNGEMTIKQAIEQLDRTGFAYILGTSKSHQKEKPQASGRVLPACDRFRVVIVAASPIRSKHNYEYNLRTAMEVWPCDPSCKDAGRFFYGCKEIISLKHGTMYQWNDVPEEESYEKLIEKMKLRIEKHKAQGSIPDWAEIILAKGAPEGERHKYCYRLGATLSQLGWQIEEIVSAIMKTPTRDIGQQDVQRAVLNGAKRGYNDYHA